MKAVVLVGGEGTRLRPLTETTPKPLLPLVDRPLLHRVLDHLAQHGVHEVVLSSPYLEETFRQFIDQREGDPKITWITEVAPLGTGGAVVNALEHLDGTFLVLNGDILTDLDLTAMLAFHRGNRAAATISLTHVADARPYGLVATDQSWRVLEFREKPVEPVPGDVNAGTYVLEPATLSGWEPGAPISIEREIYPALIARGEPVFGFLSDAYWMDLGTPEKYLQAHFDLLEGRVSDVSVPAPFVAVTATVSADARLGLRVVVGEGSSVAAGARIDDSVLHAGAVVGAGARVRGSVIGRGAAVGAGATVDGCVLAEGATVPAGIAASGQKVAAWQEAAASGSS